MTPPKAKDGRETLQERLRRYAFGTSQATKMLAEAKTKRNQAAGDEHALYHGLEPEQTLEWEAADALDAAQAEIARLTKERNELVDALSYADLRASGGIAPLPVAEDLVELAKQRAKELVANWSEGAGLTLSSANRMALELSVRLAILDASAQAKERKPRFDSVSCSQCGGAFGPGDSGFSHCDQHASLLRQPEAILPERSMTREEDDLTRPALLSASQPEKKLADAFVQFGIEWQGYSPAYYLAERAAKDFIAPTPASAVASEAEGVSLAKLAKDWRVEFFEELDSYVVCTDGDVIFLGDPNHKNPNDKELFEKIVVACRQFPFSHNAGLEEAAKKVSAKADHHYAEHNRLHRLGHYDAATRHMNNAGDYEVLAKQIRALASTLNAATGGAK